MVFESDFDFMPLKDTNASCMGNSVTELDGKKVVMQMYLLDVEPNVGDTIDGKIITHIEHVYPTNRKYPKDIPASKYHVKVLRERPETAAA